MADINIDLNIFEKALDSDLFIVFGSSFIKGKSNRNNW